LAFGKAGNMAWLRAYR